VTAEELALRREIMEAFAATGAPPDTEDGPVLRSLAAQHVVVLGDDARVVMAHPFAGHRDGARVDAGGRTWWGNCAWDGLGIVAALGRREATVTGNGLTIEVAGGRAHGDAVFHVAVPAAAWWDDIGFT
jgi:alkylmercury lyase-like protein